METIELDLGTVIKNKQEILKKLIVGKIRQGIYLDRIPSLRKLAEEHRVNVKTIQKSLESLKKDGILTVKRGEGFFVNKKTHYCIGVTGQLADNFLLDPTGPFRTIISVIEKRGDSLFYQQKKKGLTYQDLFRNNSFIDGLLIFTPYLIETRNLLYLRKKGLLFIAVWVTFPEEEINYVDSNSRKDSENGVQYLINLGHKTIVFICNYPDTYVCYLRLEGYKDALEKNGIQFDPSLVVMEHPKSENLKNKIVSIFESSNIPTAIFGASINATEETLKILGARSSELGVVVYDDYECRLSRFVKDYKIIIQPCPHIGKFAIEKLYELIEGKAELPVQIKLKSELISSSDKSKIVALKSLVFSSKNVT